MAFLKGKAHKLKKIVSIKLADFFICYSLWHTSQKFRCLKNGQFTCFKNSKVFSFKYYSWNCLYLKFHLVVHLWKLISKYVLYHNWEPLLPTMTKFHILVHTIFVWVFDRALNSLKYLFLKAITWGTLFTW